MRRTRSLKSSTACRYSQADVVLREGHLAMRTCSHCKDNPVSCIISEASPSCSECVRFHRNCDLAPPTKELSKTLRELNRIDEETLDLERKILRLRKQKTLLRKRARDLGDREAQNILELEAEEAAAEAAESAELNLGAFATPSPGTLDFFAAQLEDPAPAVAGGTSQSPHRS